MSQVCYWMCYVIANVEEIMNEKRGKFDMINNQLLCPRKETD